ncbi:MAG: 3-hydroxyacyl-CoA dehydrogenase NAD-binding domain-containing protein [Bacteroidia bacterium]
MEKVAEKKNPPSNHTHPKEKRIIRQAAVLGAGVMGSKIALHLANVGIPTLLLDITPKELTDQEKKAGLTLESPQVRNRIVQNLFQAALKSSPSPVYHEKVASLVTLGNFEDDLPKIASCDWVIEAVVEDLSIKRSLYERIEPLRKPGSLITTNTSGIPIHLLAEGRSEDFRKHFCGTHFFNPPRYLPLLEIIPSPDTSQEVIQFLMHFGERILGKETVLCKDTPAFIANRIGVFSIMHLLHLMEKYELSVEEVDQFTGPVIGHPKSATFRTADVVGIDTLVKVAQGLYAHTRDEQHEVFKLPGYVEKMVAQGFIGEKAQKGFYTKIKTDQGSEIHSLDLKTHTYQPTKKVSSALLQTLKSTESLSKRLALISQSDAPQAQFLKENLYALFSYASHRLGEIADEIYQIDTAVRAGFGWALGPFEKWDAVGVGSAVEAMEKAGYLAAPWVHAFLKKGYTHFYVLENGRKKYYSPASQSYQPLPDSDKVIILNDLRTEKVLWHNSGGSVFYLGDGILLLEFHTKMNTLGGDVLQALHKAIDLAERHYAGLVIGNQGENFSAGANLALIFMLAAEGEFDELDLAVRSFQNAIMRIRYSDIPVVVAPHGLTLGGGCEMVLHADAVQAAAETYMGLVEVGVGLIPAGGGTKECALRISDRYVEGDIQLNYFRDYLFTIGMAKVATSAFEGYKLGFLRPKVDHVSVSRKYHLSDAKNYARFLAEKGYLRPQMRQDIRVLGRTALGGVETTLYAMKEGGYISEYDAHIARKVAYVLAGGDLTGEQLVSETYLLDLEREAFLSLCGERKTQERIQYMLKTGKALRN